MTDEYTWEKLKLDSDYEISNEFTEKVKYPIRKTLRNGSIKIISEFEDGGYIRIAINQRIYFKHKLIAHQWIENDEPETKIYIDHIDRNKLNNNLNNLRWVTASENNKNKNKVKKQPYEYINKLPENTFKVSNFEEIQLDRYYYDTENKQIYLEDKRINRYKIIRPHVVKNILTVTLINSEGRSLNRSYGRVIDYFHNIFRASPGQQLN